ncbi:Predicted membrane protein [Chryseobacterium taklimakanense]|uniref:Predicted membrane protein n=2 Tax=Chryseobacterium taklimakanense TaxID=536441 RepID=A0A239XDG3_9FLAO|nr:Predicted membrane protein [Chryseobacterium taklimakanense]
MLKLENSQMKNSSLFFVYLLIIGILVRLFTLFYIPMFYAPDEEAHFKYIRYISENKHLPIAYSVTGSETKDWEFHQPPLYYIILSLFNVKSITTAFYLFRFFSVILFIITFIFSKKVLDKFAIGDFRTSVVLIFLSLLPTYIFVSSSINNDNLIIPVSVVTFYILLHSNFNRIKDLFSVSLWITLSIITKYSASVIVFFVTAYFLLQFVKQRNFKNLYQLLLIGLFTAILSAVFFLRNLALYDSVLGFSKAHAIGENWDSFSKALGYIVHTLIWSFFAVAGIINDIRPIIYPFSYLLLLGLILGTTIILKKHRSLLLLTAVFTLGINILLSIYFGYKYYQSQGRFLFPSLIFIAIIFSFSYKFLIDKFSINKKVSLVILILFFSLGYGFTILKFEKHKKEGLLVMAKQSVLIQ